MKFTVLFAIAILSFGSQTFAAYACDGYGTKGQLDLDYGLGGVEASGFFYDANSVQKTFDCSGVVVKNPMKGDSFTYAATDKDPDCPADYIRMDYQFLNNNMGEVSLVNITDKQIEVVVADFYCI